ncbi:hypothetical protein Tco_0871715 [Tanacetum coccineum]
MAPKRTTRSTRVPPVTPAPTTTTVTEAQLQALIDQGVAAAMAEAEASRVRNGYNSNGSSDPGSPHLDSKAHESCRTHSWFEKWNLCCSISNCQQLVKSKFATCTLPDDAHTGEIPYLNTTTEASSCLDMGSTEDNDDC